MNKAKPFLFGTLIGAAIVFVALQYHIVRSHDGFQFVPRTPRQSLGLAFADVRQWEPDDWMDRPELARALLAHGASDLIAESVRKSLTEAVATDSATLDQLRRLLDEARAAEAGEGTSALPPSDGGLAVPGEGERDSLRIPFPSAAREALTDPFRVADAATTEEDPRGITDTRRTAPAARNDASREPASPASPSAETFRTRERSTGSGERQPFATGTSDRLRSTDPAEPSRTQREAAAVEQLIFGDSPSSSASRNPSSSGFHETSRGTPALFDDVTSELESRARSALQRAQSTLSESAASTVERTTPSPDRFVRDPDQRGRGSSTSPTGRSDRGLRSSPSADRPDPWSSHFDPFIE